MALYSPKSIQQIMTMTMAKEQELAAAVDTLAALEERVVRAIGLLNREREQRTAVEKQLAAVREQLAQEQGESSMLRREIDELHRERETVRTRVERLMSSLDALEAAG